MITNKELSEITLSPTKKDYYQIWNELMDLASKISTRWSPDSTNESDPGIVLLKCLTAIADKTNYDIDKKILETTMPGATQIESMRELTSRQGYEMKYYQAATCKVSIAYGESNDTTMEDLGGGIYFPRFINIKNEDEDVNFVTLEEFTLTNFESRAIGAIEGELVECESDNDNIISMVHIDDNNRYYFGETGVAENGIFIFNINDNSESVNWKKVTNLNTQTLGTQVYKFGFDSSAGLPYIQFPEDIAQLVADGLRIKYIRTNGYGGNISARILSKLVPPSIWQTAENEAINSLATENFIVTNITAANNGADPESLEDAYNNFKKTVGTFDTLVTCRDYMNSIFQMTESTTDTTPLVSNIVVADIRSDINRATPLCSFKEYGICYEDKSLKETNGTTDKINHFDLVLYPFNTIYGLNTKAEYKQSFNFSGANYYKIINKLADTKTIAHNIVVPENGSSDIVAIKNYLKLKATVVTVKKVTLAEEAEILTNIYKAIFEKFNARQIDMGEEIPYDTILSVLISADARIKDVHLDDPILYTKLRTYNGTEHEVAASGTVNSYTSADELYNKLVLRNVLAGRIALFDYDDSFEKNYAETAYTGYTGVMGGDSTVTDSTINKIKTEFHLAKRTYNSTSPKGSKLTWGTFEGDSGYTLKENEVIQFRLPNFKTTYTYPAYVNYFVHLLDSSTAGGTAAIPATMRTVRDYLSIETGSTTSEIYYYKNWSDLYKKTAAKAESKTLNTATDYQKAIDTYGVVFIANSEVSGYSHLALVSQPAFPVNVTVLPLETNFGAVVSFLTDKGLTLYRSLGTNTSLASSAGKLVDTDLVRYTNCYTYQVSATPWQSIYVPILRAAGDPDVISGKATEDGLGQDASYVGLSANSDYQLKPGEYLLINYTDSSTSSSSSDTATVRNIVYEGSDEEPIFIQANFNLIDSIKYHNSHSYPKKTGFRFESTATVTNPEGMFTLGTDEQICIREMVKVSLDSEYSNIYWERLDDNTEAYSIPFTFDEVYGDSWTEDGTKDGKVVKNAYTLKPGEYFYYSNSKKTDMIYYGSGTTIVKHKNTPILKKYPTNGTSDNEEIVTYGIDVVPWHLFDLKTRSASDDRSLTIIENQYITLTEGDTLFGCRTDNTTKRPTSFNMIIDNNWKQVYTATYRFAEDEIDKYLPDPPTASMKWQVRSRLDINMGPDTAQTLNELDVVNLCHADFEGTAADSLIYEIFPTENISNVYTPVQLNCSLDCVVAADYLNLVAVDTSDNIVPLTTIDGKTAAFKATKYSSVELIENYGSGSTSSSSSLGKLSLNNYSDHWTKVTFSSYPKQDATAAGLSFTINTSIGKDQIGLIMFYYKNANTSNSVEIVPRLSSGSTGIRLFNKNENYANSLHLVEGINIIELSDNVTGLTIKADTTRTGIVVFGELSIVKADKDGNLLINPKLNYHFNSTNGTGLKQILADIQESGIADEFYYNIPVESTIDIELNPYIATDTLASPTAWYDKNNLANNFVISEIDADYLTTGITLSKNSRL